MTALALRRQPQTISADPSGVIPAHAVKNGALDIVDGAP